MKKLLNYKSLLLLGFVFILISQSCEEYPTVDTIWPPEDNTTSNPIISSITPSADSAFAGYTEISIHGLNFSPDSGNNHVYMKGTPCRLTTYSQSLLTFTAPPIVGDELPVRIVVDGALEVGTGTYRLQSLTSEVPTIGNADDVYALALDNDESVYAFIKTADGNKLVEKVDSSGVRSTFGSYTGVAVVSEMRMGPGGYLYLQRRSHRKLYRIPPSGGDTEEVVEFPSSINGNTIKITSFDFDQHGNIYLGGADGGLVIYNTNGVTIYPGQLVDEAINSIRIFNNYVYVGTVSGIWRCEITSDTGSVAMEEQVYNWDNAGDFSNSDIKSITLTANGDIIIGTDNSSDADKDPILIIKNGMLEPLYSGQLMVPASQVVWGNDIFLYVNRDHDSDELRRIIKVNMLTYGAPYYGRQ